jgi:hypothetical protein
MNFSRAILTINNDHMYIETDVPPYSTFNYMFMVYNNTLLNQKVIRLPNNMGKTVLNNNIIYVPKNLNMNTNISHIDFDRKIIFTSYESMYNIAEYTEEQIQSKYSTSKLNKKSINTYLNNIIKYKKLGWKLITDVFNCPKEYNCSMQIDATINDFEKKTDRYYFAYYSNIEKQSHVELFYDNNELISVYDNNKYLKIINKINILRLPYRKGLEYLQNIISFKDFIGLQKKIFKII